MLQRQAGTAPPAAIRPHTPPLFPRGLKVGHCRMTTLGGAKAFCCIRQAIHRHAGTASTSGPGQISLSWSSYLALDRADMEERMGLARHARLWCVPGQHLQWATSWAGAKVSSNVRGVGWLTCQIALNALASGWLPCPLACANEWSKVLLRAMQTGSIVDTWPKCSSLEARPPPPSPSAPPLPVLLKRCLDEKKKRRKDAAWQTTAADVIPQRLVM